MRIYHCRCRTFYARITVCFIILVFAVAASVGFFSIMQQQPVYVHKSIAEFYKQYLQTRYKDLFETDFKKIITPPIPYIKLALVAIENVSFDEANSFINTTLYDSPENILKKRKQYDFDDIFEPIDGVFPKLILIEGAPGIGKTTFVKELCKQWAKNSTSYNIYHFSVVILVTLRESKANCLTDLLPNDPNTDMKALKLHLNKTFSKNVLWILDGFDELSYSRNSFFLQLIAHSENLDLRIEKATVLVTSRPAATEPLLRYIANNEKSSKRFEIIGFDSKSIKNYTEYFFEKKPNQVSDFNAYYEKSPIYKTLMHMPLNAAILCLMYKDTYKNNIPVPKSNTEIYESFTCSLILWHLKTIKKYNGQTCNHGLISQQDRDKLGLPPNMLEQFNELTKIAYNGVVRKQYIFTDLNVSDDIGFMNKISSLSDIAGPRDSISFIHTTLQEFLAAIYIVNSRYDEDIQFHEVLKNEQVLMFYIGSITKLQKTPNSHIVKAIKNMINSNSASQSLAAVKCFYESPQLIKSCLTKMEHFPYYELKQILYSNLPFDYYVMGYLIAHHNISLKIRLKPKNLNHLVEGIHSSHKARGIITILEFDYIDDFCRHQSILSKIPQHVLRGLKVHYLWLKNCRKRCTNFVLSFPYLNTLKILICKFSKEDAISLSRMENLHTLKIVVYNMNETEDNLLFQGLMNRATKSIRTLELHLVNKMTNMTCPPIQKLFYPSFLKRLVLICSGSCFTVEPVDILYIIKNTNLKDITIDLNCPHMMDYILHALINRFSTVKVKKITLIEVSDRARELISLSIKQTHLFKNVSSTEFHLIKLHKSLKYRVLTIVGDPVIDLESTMINELSSSFKLDPTSYITTCMVILLCFIFFYLMLLFLHIK